VRECDPAALTDLFEPQRVGRIVGEVIGVPLDC